jgi:hypothetical protein
MSNHTYIVKVPRPHRPVYEPDRPVTDLVRNQLLHLSLAERHLPKRHRTGIDVYSIKTERQASEYIGHITSKLHSKVAEKSESRSKAERGKFKTNKRDGETQRRNKDQS